MKKFFRFQWCAISLMIGLLVGCEVKRPDGLIPESKMEELLYDYHIAQALGDNLPSDQNYKRALYTEAVFHKYGTSEAAFDSSLVWYTRNTEVLAKIYERVTKRMKTQQEGINHLIAVRDRKPQMTTSGDSVNIWIGQRLALLAGTPLSNKLTFTLPADTNFKKRDRLQWEVRYRFLEGKPDKTRAAIMGMQIVYENDSMISATKKVYQSGIQRIRLQSDTLGLIKEVRGFIYYPASNPICTLLADKITLMRYHCTDTLSTAKDSLKTDSTQIQPADSLRKAKNADSLAAPAHQRLSPEELNRRSDDQRAAKPEQLEIEKRIEQEKLQQQQQRRMNRRSVPVRNRRL
ncbi:MAG: DUF4296 domain-containing protein [Bacteroides sp.]